MLDVHHKMMISTVLESSSPSRFVDESDRVVLSDSVGDGLEREIGEEEGNVEGIHVSCSVGTSDGGIGEEEGAVEGIHVGCSVVGTILGEEEGSVEGNRVGCSVGTSDVKTHVHVVTQPTFSGRTLNWFSLFPSMNPYILKYSSIYRGSHRCIALYSNRKELS
jgi:hypothetical protein